jgi:hypothetical protein
MTNPLFIKYSYVENKTTINKVLIEENNDSFDITDWEAYIQTKYIPLIALEYINIDKIVKLY